MLIKRSSKNQISIPKAVLESAGLDENDVYFDVGCENGRIILVPMHVEEKISKQTLEVFEAKVLKQESGDRVYGSMDDAIKGLHRKHRP